MLYGYDIDGVLTNKSFSIKEEGIIITGRSYQEKEKTLKYLQKRGINMPVFFSDVPIIKKNFITSSDNKIKVIKEKGVTHFFEDEPKQAKRIHDACPDVNITVVPPSSERLLLEASIETQKEYYKGNCVDLPFDKDFAYYTFNHPDAKTFLPKKDYTIVVTFSGGMDSYISYMYAKQKYNNMNVRLLYLDYGYPYSEVEKEVIEILGLENEVYFSDYSHLADIQKEGEELWGEIFPGRNWLISLIASEYIESRGEVWISAVGGEVKELWGDKSKYFFDNASRIISEKCSKTVRVNSPLKDITKGQAVGWYIKNGYDIELLKKTVSCHYITSAIDKPCGECMGCAHRYVAMEYNGIKEEYKNDCHAYAKKIYLSELGNPFSSFGSQRLLEIKTVLT